MIISKTTEIGPVVRTNALGRDFRSGSNIVSALANVDLTIESGDFIAVMGASGSGKSTLLHLMAGLIRPTSGTVSVEGEDLAKMSDRQLTLFRRRRIGIVFQNYNLIPHLTVEENILLPVRADGRSIREDAQSRQALWEQLEITEQLSRLPDTLSGGQQQRVALARALAMSPAILLADEPTGNLDSVSSQKICRLFARLNKEEGRTIALVTHEPGVALWSNRIIILQDGGIRAALNTSEFKDAHELAARYQEIVRKPVLSDAGKEV